MNTESKIEKTVKHIYETLSQLDEFPYPKNHKGDIVYKEEYREKLAFSYKVSKIMVESIEATKQENGSISGNAVLNIELFTDTNVNKYKSDIDAWVMEVEPYINQRDLTSVKTAFDYLCHLRARLAASDIRDKNERKILERALASTDDLVSMLLKESTQKTQIAEIDNPYIVDASKIGIDRVEKIYIKDLYHKLFMDEAMLKQILKNQESPKHLYPSNVKIKAEVQIKGE